MCLTFTLTTALGLNETLIGNVGPHQIDALGEVFNTAVICLQCNLRLLGRTIFIIDTVLVANELLTLSIDIGSRQVSFLAVLIVKFEGAVQLQIVVGITKTAIAVRVPQQSVVLV